MRSSRGSQGFKMAMLPLKYSPRLISICYVRLVGKHIFFDWCIPWAAFSDSAVSWLLFFVVFFCPPPPPLLLFGPFVSGILTRRAQSPGLCWRPELFPLLARLFALLFREASASPPCGASKSHTFCRQFFFFFLPATRTFDWSPTSPPRSPTCTH